MKALVTGASGFIGRALAERLLASGWELNVLVRPGRRIELNGPARCFEADLGQEDVALLPAAAGCDAVFHAAAIRNRWGATPEDYRRVNVDGTRRLLEAARGQVGRFVYVSSVGVVGYPGVLGIDERFMAVKGTGYHASKAEAERVVRQYSPEMETVIVRPTITYGPGDRDGMLTRLAGMLSRGRFVRVGPGRNHIHLTCIEDLLSGLLLAATHPAAAGETIILAGPEPIRVVDLLARLQQALGRSPAKFYLPEALARPAALGVELLYKAGAAVNLSVFQSPPPLTRDKIDVLCRNRSFSSDKAQRLLGYRPQVGIEQGLALTLAWMALEGFLRLPAGSSTAQSGIGWRASQARSANTTEGP